MGQLASVCACQSEEGHYTSFDDQLPPLSSLYVPSKGGNHVFIYSIDHAQKVQEPIGLCLNEWRRHAPGRTGSSLVMNTTESIMFHRPALRYRDLLSSTRYNVELAGGDCTYNGAMSTVCQENSSSKVGSDTTPHYQLGVPMQGPTSPISITLPSKPSTHRFTTETNPSCEEITVDDSKELVRKAIEQNNLEALEALLNTIPDIQLFCWNWPENQGDSVLHLAVRAASLPAVMLLLRRDIGGGSGTPNSDGDTPISLAGKLHHFDLLAHLMQSVHSPYCRSPPMHLCLSINSLPLSHSPSVATTTSPASSTSSFHLASLFNVEDCNDETCSPLHQCDAGEEMNTVIMQGGEEKEVAEEEEEEEEEAEGAEVLHQQISPNATDIEEISPESIPDRSHHLASESDERIRLMHSDMEDDESVRAGSVASTHTLTLDTNEQPGLDSPSTSLASLTLSAFDTNRDNNEGGDDLLFCCSPLFHSSTKSLAAATAYMASPLKSLMMLSPQELLFHSLSRRIPASSPREKDDYGHFVDIEQSVVWGSKYTEHDHRTVAGVDDTSSEPPGISLHEDTKQYRGGGLRRLVPRRVRKAAGRFVRFLLPNGQQVTA